MRSFRCKFQYKVENDPQIYCGLFKDELVICGAVGYESLCERAEKIET